MTKQGEIWDHEGGPAPIISIAYPKHYFTVIATYITYFPVWLRFDENAYLILAYRARLPRRKEGRDFSTFWCRSQNQGLKPIGVETRGI